MSVSTTATRAELVTLYKTCENLAIMLRQVVDGSGTNALPGRFTAAEIDAQIVLVQNACTAAAA